MATATTTMLIDRFMPEFDATITEHAVIAAPPDVVFRAARNLDFLEVHSPVTDLAFAVRGLPGRVAALVGDREVPSPASIRISDLLDGTGGSPAEGWVGLEEAPDRELVFGAIGKIWQPDIEWRSVPADSFARFDEPDYAKIAVSFSVREYGDERSLLTYEARTRGTDAAATKRFLRYWWLVNRFVGHVMRAAIRTVAEAAEAEATADT